MTILHADNFSIYGTNTALMLNGVYAERRGTLVVDPDGISGGRVFRMEHTSNTYSQTLRYALQNGATMTLGVAVRMWLPNLPLRDAKTFYPIQLMDVGNTSIGALWVSSNGALVLSIGGVDYRTETPVVTANGWYHIEGKFVQTAGTPNFTMDAEIRVEGLTVLTLEAVSSRAAAFGQYAAGTSNDFSTSQGFFIKDLVIWDGEGERNNDFLGSVLVATLAPSEDISLNWTPVGAADGFSILGSSPPNDAKYISAEDDPLPFPYVCEISDLPPEVTSVKALVTYVRAGKSDGGDGGLQIGLTSDPEGSPATVMGNDRPITVAQTYWRDIFEIDPRSNGPWTPGSVNKVRMQLNRTL